MATTSDVATATTANAASATTSEGIAATTLDVTDETTVDVTVATTADVTVWLALISFAIWSFPAMRSKYYALSYWTGVGGVVKHTRDRAYTEQESAVSSSTLVTELILNRSRRCRQAQSWPSSYWTGVGRVVKHTRDRAHTEQGSAVSSNTLVTAPAMGPDFCSLIGSTEMILFINIQSIPCTVSHVTTGFVNTLEFAFYWVNLISNNWSSI